MQVTDSMELDETSAQVVDANPWLEKQSQAWQAYRSNPNDQTAWEVAISYEPIVKAHAERRFRTLPSHSFVDVEDLLMIGLMALKDCVPKFEESRKLKFMSYADARVMGAMIDELRKLDWAPRLIRGKQSKVDKARQRFYELHGRYPEDIELMDEMQVDEYGFAKLQSEVSEPRVTSLHRQQFENDSFKSVSVSDTCKDDSQQDPSEQLKRKEFLARVTQGLSRDERLIVILYYYERLTLKEIGEQLNFTESRISQMHTSIMNRLRRRSDLKAA